MYIISSTSKTIITLPISSTLTNLCCPISFLAPGRQEHSQLVFISCYDGCVNFDLTRVGVCGGNTSVLLAVHFGVCGLQLLVPQVPRCVFVILYTLRMPCDSTANPFLELFWCFFLHRLSCPGWSYGTDTLNTLNLPSTRTFQSGQSSK